MDELSERMGWLEGQQLAKPLIHIIDREADSVAHFRTWNRAGWYWLVRVKEGGRVRVDGHECKLAEVAARLPFRCVREITVKGRLAQQWLASCEVIVSRKAKPSRTNAEGKRQAPQAGEPLALRLVVSRIKDAAGTVLAQWYLLTNLPERVPDDQVALWYYYRWQIESYFKLLKEAGHQLESWEQETELAVFKRLLIAGAASVLIWRLMRATDEFGQRTREFLVRLSGRQMKPTQPITAPALLDGLFKLFVMLETLQQYSLDELQEFADCAFPRMFST